MDFTKIAAEWGTFEEWNLTRPLAIYMMRELARAHWEDEGENLGGFEVANVGLQIAIIGDEGRSDPDMIAGALHYVGRLAGFLTSATATDEQGEALDAILRATGAWKIAA